MKKFWIKPVFPTPKGIAFAALSVVLAGCATGGNFNNGPRTVSIEGDATPASAVLNSSMAGLLQRTSPSYVTLIVHEKSKRRTSKNEDSLPRALTSGSGFIVDGGYIMTAAHVAVRKGNSVDAKSSTGRIYSGKVVALQRSPDIALIKLNNFSGTAVKPAASTCIPKGAALFSLGKPHAKGDTARIGELRSMSFGRPVTYNGFGYPDAMVLQMGTRKGESGGPVFNKNGQLSGMMVSTLSDGRGHSLNLAHALPLDMLARFACANFSCSAAWRALRSKGHRNCRG